MFTENKRNKKGLTLIEVLVATSIIVFASLGLLQFYLSTLSLSETNNQESLAMTHVATMLEAIRCTPFSQITTDFPDGVVDGSVGNAYATLVGGYVLPQEHIIVSYVNPNNDPLEITARINWQDKRGAARAAYLFTKKTR